MRGHESTRLRSSTLAVEAFRQLLWYDLTASLFGLKQVCRELRTQHATKWGAYEECDEGIERRVLNALSAVSSLYWKPVRCLQTAAVATKVLRKYGRKAEMVVGYHPNPFTAHAWVEVSGRILDAKGAYPDRMHVLGRF